MKHELKFSVLALAAAMGALLSSCSRDSMSPDASSAAIRLVKAPQVIAWSGENVWTANGTKVATRGADVNGNLWYQTWDRPTNVTEEEIAKVLAAVAEPRVGATNDIHIDWNNYWVQQV